MYRKCAYLEVLDGLDAQLERGVLVADEERLRVLLEGRHRPHVVDALLHGLRQRQRLVRARDEDHHLCSATPLPDAYPRVIRVGCHNLHRVTHPHPK